MTPGHSPSLPGREQKYARKVLDDGTADTPPPTHHARSHNATRAGDEKGAESDEKDGSRESPEAIDARVRRNSTTPQRDTEGIRARHDHDVHSERATPSPRRPRYYSSSRNSSRKAMR